MFLAFKNSMQNHWNEPWQQKNAAYFSSSYCRQAAAELIPLQMLIIFTVLQACYCRAAMYVQLLEWHPWICGKETITGQKWDEASCIRQQNVQLSLGLRWLHEEYIITFGMQTEEEHLARVTLSWAMHHNLGATTCLKAKTLIYAMRNFSYQLQTSHFDLAAPCIPMYVVNGKEKKSSLVHNELKFLLKKK